MLFEPNSPRLKEVIDAYYEGKDFTVISQMLGYKEGTKVAASSLIGSLIRLGVIVKRPTTESAREGYRKGAAKRTSKKESS